MKKLVTTLLAIITLFGAIACGNCSKKKDPNATLPTIFYDFEVVDRDFNEVRFQTGYFGSASYNFDTNYVTSGSSSLELRPMGTFMNTQNPFVYFPFQSTVLGYDYKDLTKLISIDLDMYNSQSEDKLCYIGISFDSNKTDAKALETFTLKEGWNKITYVIQKEVLAISYDISTAYALAIGFDRCENLDVFSTINENVPKYFVDKIALNLSSSSMEFEDPIYLDDYEILDFEKSYQQYAFQTYGAGIKDVSIIKAADVGLTAPSGENICRIEPYDIADVSALENPMLILSENVFKKINFKQYAGFETEYKFTMWVYQDGPKSLKNGLEFYFGYTGFLDWSAVVTKQGEWVKKEIPFTHLAKFVSDPKSFRLYWAKQSEYENTVFYIDNLRIEKVS